MRLIAKDFSSKTGLLDAVLEISGKFIETPKVTIVGVPDINAPLELKQFRFRLLPNDTELDVPEMSISSIIQAFFWRHAEARISNDDEDAGTDWMSEKSLMLVVNAWSAIENIIKENHTTLDDYFIKSSSDRISKYTLSRDDLMLLLSLKGGSTLREVVLSHRQSPIELVEMLFKALSYGFLNKIEYLTTINYPQNIKAMGERINMFIKLMCERSPAARQPLANQLSHDLKLLSDIYSETDCIGINCGFVDVDEAASSLMLIKDSHHSSMIGSGILKPLNILFSSLVTSSVWDCGLQTVDEVARRVDMALNEKYNQLPNAKKPSFLGVRNE